MMNSNFIIVGSGKTHTINGSNGDYGITPRAIDFLYKALESKNADNCSVNVSIYELYNNKIFDLLNPSNEPKINLTGIDNLAKIEVAGRDQCIDLWKKGIESRRTSSTVGNSSSSRSHAITQLHIKLEENANVIKTTMKFVDLAGSEKPKDSTNLPETQFINSSLSALSTVVMNQRKKQKGVDFGQNVLTKVLKPCLTGDSKTVLFVNLSTYKIDIDSTSSSLRFAANMSETKRP